MRNLTHFIIAVVVIVFISLVSGVFYIVDESKQVIITQFGKPVGDPIQEAGLHFKMPFIQKASYFEKRLLEWDGHPNQIPTKDKKYIWVDTTARWRIKDPLKFMQSVNNETAAQARLDDIIDAATRDYITSNKLLEVVRNSNQILQDIKDREEAEAVIHASEALEKISIGREEIAIKILENAAKTVPQYGIELVDMRIKRINYVKEVRTKVYDRMIAERKRAAEQYRSEGQGKKAEIEGFMLKELKSITSEAYKTSEELKGKADAESIKIYANAYNKDPNFYSFTKTLDTYKKTVDKDTMMILSTEGDYYKFLKGDIAN